MSFDGCSTAVGDGASGETGVSLSGGGELEQAARSETEAITKSVFFMPWPLSRDGRASKGVDS